MADAGRVISGRAAGRRLAAPGPATRPLADRVKQTLFAILEPDLPGSAFLDLFAGSGAAGIEALSRGASCAVFVERDHLAARTIDENLRRCGLDGEAARVRREDVPRYLERDAAIDGPFDLVLVDPPYDDVESLLHVLKRLGADNEARILSPRARVVAKYFWRDRPPAAVGLLASERERRFGDTALTFYRLRQDGEPGQVGEPGQGGSEEGR